MLLQKIEDYVVNRQKRAYWEEPVVKTWPDLIDAAALIARAPAT